LKVGNDVYQKITGFLLWRTDPLLGKDLERNNETTAVDMQRRGKHVPVARQLRQLDYNNGNGDFFYMVRAEELS
jgi:hypothetical protein